MCRRRDSKKYTAYRSALLTHTAPLGIILVVLTLRTRGKGLLVSDRQTSLEITKQDRSSLSAPNGL